MENKNNQYWGNAYCFYGYSIFLGALPQPKLHSYHMTEILIGNKKPVRLMTENNTYESNVFLVGPDVRHTAVYIEKEMVIIMIDPESDLSRNFTSKYLDKKDIVPLSIKINKEVIKQYFNNPTAENAVKIYTSTINSLGLGDNIKIQKDQRIIDAANYINNLEVKKTTTKEIAKHVGLSEGRLIHLFKEQIGIPVRRYLIWRRISDALGVLISGKSPTYAAHEAEFADYAHLSRSFSTMFGYSVSTFFNLIKFVKIETAI